MPQTNKGYRRRNSLRHPHYDYTRPGAYFVTICQHRRKCVFGTVVDHAMIRNPLGQLAADCLTTFETRHPSVTIDTAIIMPNHAHILLWINREPGQIPTNVNPKERKFADAIVGSLPSLMGAYKGSVTQLARNRNLWPQSPLWQDDFYDYIVRDENELACIRDYIVNNPARWYEDQLHPHTPNNPFHRS